MLGSISTVKALCLFVSNADTYRRKSFVPLGLKLSFHGSKCFQCLLVVSGLVRFFGTNTAQCCTGERPRYTIPANHPGFSGIIQEIQPMSRCPDICSKIPDFDQPCNYAALVYQAELNKWYVDIV